jgi:hypothetical protein
MTRRSHGLSICSTVLALFAVAAVSAHAEGKFDGTWFVDVPASLPTAGTSESTCPALRFPIQVSGNWVGGSLERIPGSANRVGPGYDSKAVPVTGSVKPDGTINARWRGYKAAGMLQGDTGTITIQGSCGPREAKATRMPDAMGAK